MTAAKSVTSTKLWSCWISFCQKLLFPLPHVPACCQDAISKFFCYIRPSSFALYDFSKFMWYLKLIQFFWQVIICLTVLMLNCFRLLKQYFMYSFLWTEIVLNNHVSLGAGTMPNAFKIFPIIHNTISCIKRCSIFS